MHARGKCDAVFVDYLQLIEPTAGKGKNGTREQEVAHMSRRLKLMAKSLNVPVFALAQMNRESEKRKGGEPTLADLRDSGAIEQDADCVMFPFRYGKYNEKAGDVSAIIIGKNRNGETGKVDCRWSGKRMCFLELHDSDEEQVSPI
jgi:replicative DNA helicase